MMQQMENAVGKVTRAFGNLLYVKYEGQVRQGEVCYIHIDDVKLMGEVIEIVGYEVKVQVFEDTREIAFGTSVDFTGHLLEAELGPGLLTSIYDGLQNPLEKVAEEAGLFLKRGIYLSSLDKTKKWEFTPTVEKGTLLKRGDQIGTVPEGKFTHKIMVPFHLFGQYKVKEIAPASFYKIDEVIAKVEDEKGQEISLTMMQKWPVKMPLMEGRKLKPEKMMDTGLRTFDTQFPVLKGGTFCSPGPFGAGKTVLQHHLSKYSSVDIVVIVACGERAGEVVEVLRTFPELIDARTSEPLIKRTVIIGNTSSMPVAAREASVYMGVTIAEYYRQMGYDVLLLADSTSRWAQAMREMSGRLEEIPGEEAFPAYLASRIAAFYERAGAVEVIKDKVGTLTIGGTVSPAGGNFEEPVTQSTLSVVGAFHGLSRARSDARRYPAIDPLLSWTKYGGQVGKEMDKELPGWFEKVELAKSLMVQGDEIGKRMEVIGEEGIAIEDIVVYLKSELYDNTYLQQNAFDKEDAYCPLNRQIELFSLLSEIFEKKFSFDSHDDARTFFLYLQNEIKNMNYLPFHSDEYNKTMANIRKKLEEERAS
jgi:V/A-type H+/Na+-transporting ATPase subunit A